MTDVLLWVFEGLALVALVALLDAWRKLRAVLRELDRIRDRWNRHDGYG